MYTKKQIPTPFLQNIPTSEHPTTRAQPEPPKHLHTKQNNTSHANPAILALAFLLCQNER